MYQIDERQEKIIGKGNSLILGFVYWTLFASIVIQALFLKEQMSQWAVEFVLFIALSFCQLVVYFKAGIWEMKKYKITSKIILVTSTISALLLGGLILITNLAIEKKSFSLELFKGIYRYCIFAFVGTFVILSLYKVLLNKKLKKTNEELDQN